jgi:hypothetical protein
VREERHGHRPRRIRKLYKLVQQNQEMICRRQVDDTTALGTARWDGRPMLVLDSRKPTSEKRMHTRPCGNHIIPGYCSARPVRVTTDPELTGEIAGRCKVGNLFLRFFAGRSIQPTQSLGRASSCRKAQGGHNHLRHMSGDASGGETTMKGNTCKLS